MCNFVIRPIKSYATITVKATIYDKDGTNPRDGNLLRGDYLEVTAVDDYGVHGLTKDGSAFVEMDLFVHTFTANPDDIEKMRKAEYKTMGYDPDKKKKKEDKSS